MHFYKNCKFFIGLFVFSVLVCAKRKNRKRKKERKQKDRKKERKKERKSERQNEQNGMLLLSCDPIFGSSKPKGLHQLIRNCQKNKTLKVFFFAFLYNKENPTQKFVLGETIMQNVC
jgi:hypothetical protein